MPSKDEYVIGFDLGGTKMMATALDMNLDRLASERRKTKAIEGGESIYDRIVGCIEELLGSSELEKKRLRGIGVGSPGPLDPKTGVVIDTANFAWDNFPLGERLSKDFDVPVAVDNDVNMGTYGEYHFGAGKGYRNVIGLFPGTGIGGGLILDGRLYRGSSGNAGELGHIIVEIGGPRCGCGRRGCLEALASRLAIASQAAVVAARGEAPHLLELAGTDIAKIRSGALAKAIRAGDALIEDIVRNAARYLGVALGSYVNVFNPDIFILGGGLVEKLEDIYLEETVRAMHEHSFPFLAEKVQVLAARLGDDAAVMGAGKLILEKLEKKEDE